MPFSSYSSQGFEDEAAKHNTTFEAKVPEARDPSTFPAGGNHGEDQDKTWPNYPKQEEHKTEQDDRYTSGGFIMDNSTHDGAELKRTEEAVYTAEGFAKDKKEEGEGGCPKL
ncbi:hypothetical protein DL546_002657 [Coniochaeta pulveracea]|uniref:Uncharacterized protein n=1 Tax=Coniochaeta pulveracea TaxID=177199 RepID=A0A420Y8B3_9PEZI|nr:hypothetical protein DL546_002657 [Coniochaeta pulveracea]